MALSSAAASGDGVASEVVRLPWSSTVTPGAWEPDSAATASAATAAVAAPLYSRLPNCADIE